MKFEKDSHGNLILLSEKSDKDMLDTLKLRHGGDDMSFLEELLEKTGWEGNGLLMHLNPEDIAALTDAPILTDDRTIEDDGSVTVSGKIWWFPNYMVTNFADELIDSGRTVFTLAGN